MDKSEVPPESARAPGTWTRQRIVFLAVTGVLALVMTWWTREVLLPFILALIIAYVLTPAVALAERGKIPRSVAIILVYLITGGATYLAVALVAPRIYDEALQLSRETPALAHQLATKWGPAAEDRVNALLGRRSPKPLDPQNKSAIEVVPLPDGGFRVELGAGIDIVQDGPKLWRIKAHRPLDSTFSVTRLLSDGVDETMDYLKRNVLELIRVGQVIISKLTRGIFLMFMTLMVAGYIMHTREHIIAFFRSLPPPGSRRSFDRLLMRIDRGMSGVVRGQLIICGVNGVLSAIGFVLFGLKYWPILALIAAIMSIIPIFGSILSSIPAVLIGLTQDFWTALWVLLWIIAIHQVEANLLNPKIIGVAARLHPVLVVFALIVGEHAYGLWGALLAVPALSLTQSIFNHFRFESMPDMPPDSVILQPTPPPPATTSE